MNDKVYAYPTDTVWGLGGTIHSKNIRGQIDLIKKTDSMKPVSILFSELHTLLDYINFPSYITDNWLQNFFNFESTLCVPLAWIRDDKIQSHIYCNSSHIAFRLLASEIVREICHEAKGPIITTSLNLHGGVPINTYQQAKDFIDREGYNIDLRGDSTVNLSSRSSTIIKIELDLNWTCLREGEHFEDIKELMDELPSA